MAGKDEFRCCGGNADHAGRGIATAQRALRTPKNLDPFDWTQFAERIAAARPIDAVDEDGHGAFQTGVVANRADAADTGRTISFVAGRRDQQGGSELVEFANIAGAALLQLFGTNRRHGNRNIRQRLRTPLGGNDDDIAVDGFVDLVGRIGLGLGVDGGSGKCCKCERARRQIQRESHILLSCKLLFFLLADDSRT